MFIVDDTVRLRRAKARALANRPEVKVIAYGRYKVASSKGNYYAVTVSTFGFRTGVDCGCTSGQYGNECYHAAAALLSHATLSLTAAHAPAARDQRLRWIESDLRRVARVADRIEGNFEAVDDIHSAVRAALKSLDEYELDLLPAVNEEAA